MALSMNKNIITEKLVGKILQLLHTDYDGEYQKRIINHMIMHDECIIQTARQIGKSFLAACMATIYMMMGKTVIIALPTIKQGSRIIHLQVRQNIQTLSHYFECLKPIIDNQGEMSLANGGKCIVLSTDDMANREGYTASLIIIDESHKAKPSVLSDLSPILDRARLKGDSKLILLGIGGYRGSLIEVARKERGYNHISINCYDVIKDNPSYEDRVIVPARRTLSPEEFSQEYECMPMALGQRYIFHEIPNDIDIPCIYEQKPNYYIGIDWGSKHDYTVVTVIAQHWDIFKIIDSYQTRGTNPVEQVEQILSFISSYPCPRNHITVEANGFNQGYYGYMQEAYKGIGGFYLTENNKNQLIRAAQMQSVRGRISISPMIYRNEINSLTYEIKENGKADWEHSDYLSSLILAMVPIINRVK